jgi:hypothetical protein
MHNKLGTGEFPQELRRGNRGRNHALPGGLCFNGHPDFIAAKGDFGNWLRVPNFKSRSRNPRKGNLILADLTFRHQVMT